MEYKIAFLSALFHFIGLAKSYWWSIGNTDMHDYSPDALMTLHQFTLKQRLMMEENPKLLPIIGKGAWLAIGECQRQFKDERWNCTNYSSESVFGKILNTACRETSFIYAITAAGVTFSLTQSCARGHIKGCFCHRGTESKSRNGNGWIFEGCHDNIKYGYINSKLFTSAKETSNDFRSTINKHNNEAGRLAVVSSMGIRCKCHGVSGNCNLRTCRKTLPQFNKVGELLKERYNTASKVESAQVSGKVPPQIEPAQASSKTRTTRNSGQAPNGMFLNPTVKDLVYFEDSPNFCKENLDHGSLGVQGRYCNASLKAKGVDGCEILCCGRKWKTKNLTRNENCSCEFKWCCSVVCKECQVTREYSYCT